VDHGVRGGCVVGNRPSLACFVIGVMASFSRVFQKL
jgi:hypothetical protein